MIYKCCFRITFVLNVFNEGFYLLVMDELPRERLIEKGAQALSSWELFAILLRTGTKGHPVDEVARDLLKRYSLLELSRLSVEQLCMHKGVSSAKATTLVSAFELARRVSDVRMKNVVFSSSTDVVDYCRSYFSGFSHERVVALFVTTKNGLLKAEVMHEGSIDYSIIEPRKIVKRALELQASGLFLLHNHPSGDPSPSKEDRNVTTRMGEVCRLLHLRFLDHIVYGSEVRYYSFFDNNEL